MEELTNYPRTYFILGGDLRQAYMAQALADSGYRVESLGNPFLPDTMAQLPLQFPAKSCVILPIRSFDASGHLTGGTALRDSEIFSRLQDDTYLFGGLLSKDLLRKRVVDLMALPRVAIANAVPTAEGAIQLLLEKLPVTLHGAKCLVIGFGRIGKALSLRLQALHAEVTVAARREAQLAEIETLGLRSELTHRYRHGLRQYDCILNTVPAPVLDDRALEETRPDCLLLDLASAPGGIDRAGCQAQQRQCIPAPGLPGKTAPKTAGKILLEAIFQTMEAE